MNTTLPPVLDPCCSSRGFWFNKTDPRALFTDNRSETLTARHDEHRTWTIRVDPDLLADFTALPFPDYSFWHVIFDPPHFTEKMAGAGNIKKQYGFLSDNWRGTLRNGFKECFRVLKPYGTLIFKWAETEIPLREILALTPEAPLYGHKRKDAGTHWVAFLKSP